MDAAWAFLQWYGAPLIMATVSVVYFFADRRRPAFAARFLSSAHGIAGVLLYFAAFAIWLSSPNQYRPSFGYTYAFLFLVPVVLIVISIFTFQGSRLIHLLQLPNLLAMVWALFVGSMAVTGDWL